MSRSATAALRDGVILNNRYRIVKQIGRGGFGRAYLAEDTQRYRELCVLKEFAPQVAHDDELRQAEDLFEREAGILYRLNHHQIPRFEALLKTRIDGRRSLFLVQEYILGESYWDLLQRRGRLTEAEVNEMIRDILPVLDYIHESELIHRDISPDNLILRDHDRKPVLIDFGCVKLAANAVSKSTGHSVTLIGKQGYSPVEQISRGQTLPCSDLYSLAATAVVLLTGKQPDRLYNSHEARWDWHLIDVNPALKKVLRKMLADKPGDRYQSVKQVYQALDARDSSIFTSFISRIRTLKVAPGVNSSSQVAFTSRVSRKSSRPINPLRTRIKQVSRTINYRLASLNFRSVKPWHWGLIASGIIIIPGLISFSLMNYRITHSIGSDSQENDPDLILAQDEVDSQLQIHQRVKSLKLDSSAFYKEVDTIFHQRYPEMAGKQLSNKSEHQQYRQVWYQIASKQLAQRERKR